MNDQLADLVTTPELFLCLIAVAQCPTIRTVVHSSLHSVHSPVSTLSTSHFGSSQLTKFVQCFTNMSLYISFSHYFLVCQCYSLLMQFLFLVLSFFSPLFCLLWLLGFSHAQLVSSSNLKLHILQYHVHTVMHWTWGDSNAFLCAGNMEQIQLVNGTTFWGHKPFSGCLCASGQMNVKYTIFVNPNPLLSSSNLDLCSCKSTVFWEGGYP